MESRARIDPQSGQNPANTQTGLPSEEPEFLADAQKNRLLQAPHPALDLSTVRAEHYSAIHDCAPHGSSLLLVSASANKNSAILFLTPPPVLFLPAMSGTEAENLHLLAAVQPLQ